MIKIAPIYDKHTDSIMVYFKNTPSVAHYQDERITLFLDAKDSSIVGVEVTGVKELIESSDWVTQDRVPARPGIDERAWLYNTGLSSWEDANTLCWGKMPMHGEMGVAGGILQLRCLRKDLPPVPVVPKTEPATIKSALQQFVVWHDMDHEEMKGSEVQAAYDKVIADAKAALQSPPADKPRVRTVTLREYRRGDGLLQWTTRNVIPQETGRTCEVEVPE